MKNDEFSTILSLTVAIWKDPENYGYLAMPVTVAYVQGGTEIQFCVSNGFVSSNNIATIWANTI